jgi:outer membrane protein, multidrug efflux system
MSPFNNKTTHFQSLNLRLTTRQTRHGFATAFAVTLLSFALAGCRVGPNYARPAATTPQAYRGTLAPDISDQAAESSIADKNWSSVFEDQTLRQLVDEALANNLDLQIAAKRILQAQAQVGIVRSDQLPSLSGGGSYNGFQEPPGLAGTKADGSPGNRSFHGGGLSANAAWNLDFWGLYRRQSEAARAELLATEWAQKATRSSLVEGVASAYFRLRSLDAQLDVTNKTIEARRDSLKLVTSLEKYGAGSLADTRQAEELLHAAQANLPEIRRQIALQENTISILLGHNPEAIIRGLPVDRQPHPLQLPVGLPSELIERRPDIRQAEAKLIAANARIGVAKAQFFPNISLTGAGGSSSNQLQTVLSGKNAYWYAAGSLSEPIFDGGRIRSNYHLSKAAEEEALLAYRKVILDALRDVSNSLVTYRESHEHRDERAAQVTAASDAVRLARLRYSGGDTSYLEVLTTDTNLYDAQLNLAQAQEEEATSLVQLYAALGGGWK